MKDNYALTLMNFKTSALIRRSPKNGFVVQTLEDGASKFIPDVSLKESKTMQSFLTKFVKEFDSKRLLLSVDANSKIVEMLSESESTETETENDTSPIPYSVVDLSTLLLVSKSKNGFEVESLSTGQDKFVPNSDLFGNYYKYTYDFALTFAYGFFQDLDGISLLVSEEAYNSLISIMAFNRIDC